MHTFMGKWITDEEFSSLSPRNVFHRQLEPLDLPCDEHRNRHILFRKHFSLNRLPERARVFVTADDYYKLYINGRFVCQGPAPAYHFQYPYNEVDVTDFLREGENTIAVHTLYQGLINRVWQSGDGRHGLILDLCANGETLVASDESFLTHPHDAYREIGTVGYQTQFLEEYDSRAATVGFEESDFDDTQWKNALPALCDDHTLVEQTSAMLVFEKIAPVLTEYGEGGSVILDFGAIYVGYLNLRVRGKSGDTVTLRAAQERNEDGSLRFKLRANCVYEETWILSDGESVLDQFDYKSFRYAEVILPEGAELLEASFEARHYPFTLRASLKKEYRDDDRLRAIWDLCVNSQRYGVQEVIQDCMEREKGFYLGDGCYTALAHMILTGDDTMARKLIEDAFSTSFITDGLVTCMNCSYIQEIAEFPLMMVYLILWHYNLTHDTDFLAAQYPKVVKLLEVYRRDYEKDGLLCDLDKWCVVEWPNNFRDGYDVNLKEGRICTEPHVSINAYYIYAVRTANRIAAILQKPPYRDEKPLLEAFTDAFYDTERKLFCDGRSTRHVSIVGNAFPFAFDLYRDEAFKKNYTDMLCERGIHSLSLFCTFPVLMGLIREGEDALLREMLLDEGAWLRILREGGTTTFEGWGKDTKANASLFHLTMSYAAVFLADVDHAALFGEG